MAVKREARVGAETNPGSEVDSGTAIGGRQTRPTWTAERLAQLQLALIDGVGPRTRQLLLEYFGTAEAVFAAGIEQLSRVTGVGPKLSRRICEAPRELDIDGELDACRDHQIAVILHGDVEYPRRLSEIPDPPGVLFVKGELRSTDELAVAIVGTRHATYYGLQQSERLASGLARAGFTVVSGLARGVDAAAHRGTLAASGRTFAVLGCGFLRMYPPEHEELADAITQQGAVISESPPRRPPMSGLFPQRNRVITGLSLGVIVIEAGQRSGALVSARHGMEQGREVFALPGRVDNRMSYGCHQLLRDGAHLVETVDDVITALGPLAIPAQTTTGRELRHPAELTLSEHEQQLLDVIETTPQTIDRIASRSRLPIPRVLATLSVLEMRRLIRRLSGSLIVRV
jgi:DNA processing protein